MLTLETKCESAVLASTPSPRNDFDYVLQGTSHNPPKITAKISSSYF
jgi:hypothetical protein